MRFFKIIALFAAVICLIPTAVQATSLHPRILISNLVSSNWAGYIAANDVNNPANNSVSDVKATWTVPAVKCSLTLNYEASWVGIDGGFSNSVEQDGSDSDCFAGHAYYDLWYEMFPANPVALNIIPNPGDSITAEVHYDGIATNGTGNLLFTLSISDNTSGKNFSIQLPIAQDISGKIALRNSAEWVIEAPFGPNVLPLANFGTTAISSGTATINGATGAISSFSNQADNMGSRSTGRIKAQTSALSGGSAFSVKWISSQ